MGIVNLKLSLPMPLRAWSKGSSPAPPSDITSLLERLDGVRIVMLTHERDRRGVGHAIEDGQAGQGRPGAPATTGAGDLNPLCRGALPGFGQSGQHVCLDRGQAEVRPPEPS